MAPSQPALAGPVADAAVLGVERSMTGRRWVMRISDGRTALALAQRLDVPEVVGRVMAGRGVAIDEADAFLSPTLRRLLPDPSALRDMDAAAERLANAIVGGERIAVLADYDVDGATAAALLARFLAAVGSRTRLYVPDRLREGYGPSGEALRALKGEGTAIVVTVDCGISAHEALDAAADAGLEVIVCDHHAADGPLPRAVALINPNRPDDDSGCGHLAAVGVAFLLVVAVNRVLRRMGHYRGRPEPDLRQWLDLVALGTVCDQVPLRGVNRAFVAQGLKVMAGRANTGLRALADLAGVREVPGTYHAGFVLGPRINAGGRVGEADLGARLLSTDDHEEAATIAHRLEAYNRERQQIEALVLDAALTQIEAGDPAVTGAPLFVAAGEHWHPGVIGIVASRLVERFGRPVLVVAFEDGCGTGSGRSIPGIDLGAAVNAARRAGLLIKGGGHAMAAGFTVARAGFDDLRRFLQDWVDDRRLTTPDPMLPMDGTLTVSGASSELLATLARVGPFGSGNPEPRFVVAGARVDCVATVGVNHLRCALVDERGTRLDGFAFRCLDRPLGEALRRHGGAPLHVAGRLQANTWRGGGRPRLVIDDAAPTSTGTTSR
ncbi:MAG: single-stranded-DNA-specific exonuclease RecJ [Rhodospirillales bacterium]